jgi:hypothetical protein
MTIQKYPDGSSYAEVKQIDVTLLINEFPTVKDPFTYRFPEKLSEKLWELHKKHKTIFVYKGQKAFFSFDEKSGYFINVKNNE